MEDVGSRPCFHVVPGDQTPIGRNRHETEHFSDAMVVDVVDQDVCEPIVLLPAVLDLRAMPDVAVIPLYRLAWGHQPVQPRDDEHVVLCFQQGSRAARIQLVEKGTCVATSRF